MKIMINEIGVGAFALSFLAPIPGTHQGTAVSGAVRGTGFGPALGGARRLRARDLSLAPDSLPGGPVI